LYEKELEMLAQMSLIQRFPLRTELYDKLLQSGEGLERLDIFFRPLFHKAPEKIYNLNKSLELQRPIRKKMVEEDEEVLDFDEEEWQEELVQRKKAKLAKYEGSLNYILEAAFNQETITLQELKEMVEEQSMREVLIPDIDIFKEIMVELIKARSIDLNLLRKEKTEYILEDTLEFQLQDMILKIVDQDEKKRNISKIFVSRTEDGQGVKFENVVDAKGIYRTIRCSNVEIAVET
jgi:hypothetical protein